MAKPKYEWTIEMTAVANLIGPISNFTPEQFNEAANALLLAVHMYPNDYERLALVLKPHYCKSCGNLKYNGKCPNRKVGNKCSR